MHDPAVFLLFFLSTLTPMFWQPWPMIAMWPSVSPCSTQSSCPLGPVLYWWSRHTWWDLLVPWSTQDLCLGSSFVIPTPSTTTCVTSSPSSSSPTAAPTSMSLWVI
jgi:hypothetical protein